MKDVDNLQYKFPQNCLTRCVDMMFTMCTAQWCRSLMSSLVHNVVGGGGGGGGGAGSGYRSIMILHLLVNMLPHIQCIVLAWACFRSLHN